MLRTLRDWVFKLPAITKVAAFDAGVLVVASVYVVLGISSPLPTPGGTIRLQGFTESANKSEHKVFSGAETQALTDNQKSNNEIRNYKAPLMAVAHSRSHSNIAPGEVTPLTPRNTEIPTPPAAEPESRPIRALVTETRHELAP